MLKRWLHFVGIISGMMLCVFLLGCDSTNSMEFETVEKGETETGDNEIALEKTYDVENKTEVTDRGESSNQSDNARQTINDEATANIAGKSSLVQERTSLYVHICGEVVNPGVYEIKPDERLFVLVEKAGGFTEAAAVDYMNQAQIIKDGDKIYIPSKAEVEETGVSLTEQISRTGDTSKSDKESKLVDINSATEEELMTLPGIGSSKAKKIIAYREEIGSYETIEQLMDITGIKEGVFNTIKDYVVVR